MTKHLQLMAEQACRHEPRGCAEASARLAGLPVGSRPSSMDDSPVMHEAFRSDTGTRMIGPTFTTPDPRDGVSHRDGGPQHQRNSFVRI